MRSYRSLIVLAIALANAPRVAAAQIPRPMPPVVLPRYSLPEGSLDEDDRSGPRVGAAYLIGGSVTAERAGKHIGPFISLFGWQLEHQFETGH